MTETKDKVAEKGKKSEVKSEKKSDLVSKPSYDELLDMLMRSQANLENFRKQMEKRIDDIRDFAKRDVILRFIPVLDSFDLATKGMTADAAPEIAEGFGMIRTQLGSTLKDLGVEGVPIKGQFNPLLHEALAKVPSNKPEGEIIMVFQRGYQLHGKVLRAARVQVSAGEENKE